MVRPPIPDIIASMNLAVEFIFLLLWQLARVETLVNPESLLISIHDKACDSGRWPSRGIVRDLLLLLPLAGFV